MKAIGFLVGIMLSAPVGFMSYNHRLLVAGMLGLTCLTLIGIFWCFPRLPRSTFESKWIRMTEWLVVTIVVVSASVLGVTVTIG